MPCGPPDFVLPHNGRDQMLGTVRLASYHVGSWPRFGRSCLASSVSLVVILHTLHTGKMEVRGSLFQLLIFAYCDSFSVLHDLALWTYIAIAASPILFVYSQCHDVVSSA